MEELIKLNNAFQTFTEASKVLEEYYRQLNLQVKYLTDELERKNKELNLALAEIKKSKEFLQGLIENMQEGILVLNEEEKVLMYNRSAKKILNLETDVRGKNIKELGLVIDFDNKEYITTVKNKKYHFLLSVSNIIDSEGLIQGHAVLFRDITEIKEFEKQRERNKRLIAMGEMSAKIVHEIRSPLCSIELYASMLADAVSNTEHKDLAMGICSGIKSLNNILSNMLFYAKPNEIVETDVCLEEVIEETLKLIKPVADSRNIKLCCVNMDNSIIKGDKELLKQAFLNVIINAIQASKDYDTIHLKINRDSEKISFEVADSGQGIDPEDIENIFNPFFSTKDKGTGLGLTITSMIIQKHRGTISVESEKGKGSIFRISFPQNY